MKKRFEQIRIFGGKRMRFEIGSDACHRFAVTLDRRSFADSFAAIAGYTRITAVCAMLSASPRAILKG